MQKNAILEVKTENLHLFLQNGFFNAAASTAVMHSHGYTEIHLVIEGQIRFLAGDQTYTLRTGDILAIPRNTYHACIERDAGTWTVPFQVGKHIRQIKTARIAPVLAAAFGKEIETARQTNNFKTVVTYISLLCDPFFESEQLPAVVSRDYALIINEFFSNRYHQQITLATLARELNLSEKQTARMVGKYTGRTFLQELTRRRIGAADYLIRSTDLTMREIAEHVGFKSYSGFWKAYKKQEARDAQPETAY